MDGGSRRVFVFFYGLFMDEELLRGRGLSPRDAAPAVVDGFGLRVGERADLIVDPSERVYGVLISLSVAEVDRLYADPTVRDYRPHFVTARRVHDGKTVAARCYTLPDGSPGTALDRGYLVRLREVGAKVGLPAAYLDALKPDEE